MGENSVNTGKIGKGKPPKHTQFEKGTSGNPKGRPAGVKNRSTIARQVLEMGAVLPDKIYTELKKLYPTIEKQMTVEEIATIVQANKAITKQDTYAFLALLDSAYGKAPQAVKIGGDPDNDAPVKFTVDARFTEGE